MNSSTWGQTAPSWAIEPKTFTSEGFFPRDYGTGKTPFCAGGDNITTYVKGSTPGSLRRVSIPRSALGAARMGSGVSRTGQHRSVYGGAAYGDDLIAGKTYTGSNGWLYTPKDDWSIAYQGPNGQKGVQWAETQPWKKIMEDLGSSRIVTKGSANGKGGGKTGSTFDIGGAISAGTKAFSTAVSQFGYKPSAPTVSAPTFDTGAGAGSSGSSGLPTWALPVGAVAALLVIGAVVVMSKKGK